MIETNLAIDLCDQREDEYGTPLSHHERHLIAWVLWVVTADAAVGERFDRERYTQDGAAA